jgi:hypothetical protein
MTKRIDRDPGREIQIALAVLSDEPHAFASLEGEVDTRKSRHQMRCHGTSIKAAPALCGAV